MLSSGLMAETSMRPVFALLHNHITRQHGPDSALYLQCLLMSKGWVACSEDLVPSEINVQLLLQCFPYVRRSL